MNIRLAVAAALWLIAPASWAFLATPTITWEVPTENTDGSPLYRCDVDVSALPQADQDRIAAGECIAGYLLFWGTESGSYSRTIKIVDPSVTSHQLKIRALRDQVFYFAAQTLQRDGITSDMSNEATYTARSAGSVRILFKLGGWKVCADGWRVLAGRACP